MPNMLKVFGLSMGVSCLYIDKDTKIFGAIIFKIIELDDFEI